MVFTLHCAGQKQDVTAAELERYADQIGLRGVVPGRYSLMFVADVLVHEWIFQIDPHYVVDAIKDEEGARTLTRTKPAAEFTGRVLRGLWHKHYFSPRFIPHNIASELPPRKLASLIEEITNSGKSSDQVANEIAHRVVVESFETRMVADLPPES